MIILADSADALNWTVLLPVVAGGLAVWYMLPSPKRRPVGFGILAGVIGLAGLAAFLVRGSAARSLRRSRLGCFSVSRVSPSFLRC